MEILRLLCIIEEKYRKGVKKMKKIKIFLSLALMAALLFSLIPAQAEQRPMQISCPKGATISAGQTASILQTKINRTSSGAVSFTLIDTTTGTVVYNATRSALSSGCTITWPVPYYDAGMSASKNVKRMSAVFKMDGQSYKYTLYYTYNANGGSPTVTIEGATWYSNNTACSFGIAFRDIKPRLTDKWYHFTPIDLTIQGRQEYDYIASNLYIIGKVYVDVYGDSVVVTYHNYYDDQGGNTQTLSEFLYFFPDLASVKRVEPEEMGIEGYSFGQPISIENDLGGDTNVLLFVRNRVTYCDYVTNSHKLTRFWPNLQERKDARAQMLLLMDQ